MSDKPLPDPVPPDVLRPDAVADAARALLGAIEAEPVPPHLVALAAELDNVLRNRPKR